MSERPITGTDVLAQLRSSFDHSFGVLAESCESPESVIQIRVGSEGFAVRACQIAGLVKSRKIVPLPGRITELLGVAALRSSLVPVYDLAALLGIPASGSGATWLLLVPGETLIGLAIDGFEGRQVPEWLGDEQSARQHIRQLVRVGSAVRAVLDIPGIAAAIRQRAGLTEQDKGSKQ